MTDCITIARDGYTATIDLQHGANCIRLQNSRYGADILRQPERPGETDNPYTYGMPVLYPANRISGGRFIFEGREYRFPINEPATNCHLHGEVHRAAFVPTEQKPDTVRCTYIYDKKTAGFPHRYEMTITYSLSACGLLQKTEITNLSDHNMPHFLGFHTTFNLPFVQGSCSENIRILGEVAEEIERNMQVYLPTGRILPDDEITAQFRNGRYAPYGQSLSRLYRAGASGRIALLDTRKKLKIVYENDQKFLWRLFYKSTDDTFICLEPMTCMANCQNAPFDREYAGFDSIAPGQSKAYLSRVYVTENV